MIKQTEKDSKIAERLLKKQRLFEKRLAGFFEKIGVMDLEKATNKRLLGLYNNLYRIYVPFIAIAAIPEIGDSFAEHHVVPVLKGKEGIREDEINEVMIMFSTPAMWSFMDHERADFLRLCLGRIRKSRGFGRMLKRHARRYFWIKNNYSQTFDLDERYFLERVDEEIRGMTENDIRGKIAKISSDKEKFRKKKAAFRRKYELSSGTLRMFSIYEIFGVMIDERKRTMLKANHYITKILNEAGARYGLGWKEISNYSRDEVNSLLSEGRLVPEGELKGRIECCVYMTSTLEGNLLIKGKEAKQIIEAFDRKIKEGIVKGIVANRAEGNITGEVNVILDPHKEEFPEGRILVTTMTRPDFLHIMRKAKAVITDEGGITCHAAIVSREMGIPCIIGTKNGTRVLKTGDKVEIDTRTGIIKKI
ncbi:hypothetical protein COV19_03585 [Candidatus Woesearchaeota archaeon CG10_big_fil_rev_8_21_14_0_10_44_13]|nr:MAG: hypothetical protein COV19_03585 [Candidatus Woesearchaeota archaeon CG10_big_fil_rev_8_21_14_0_10_44_13]